VRTFWIAPDSVARNFWNAPDRAELLERVQKVGPDSRRRWGKMTSHQMICHVADAFRGALGLIELQPRAFHLERPVKWLALYTPGRWPQGYPAPREINQVAGAGTRPFVFTEDRDSLLILMQRFTPEGVRGRKHPLWGRMSDWEWGRWGYLHTDHHLRQFGV
jgi:hypothetical protein